MVKSLKQIGNSYGVIIEKPILEILHITPETPLEITTDGRSLQIRPVRQRKKPALKELLSYWIRRGEWIRRCGILPRAFLMLLCR